MFAKFGYDVFISCITISIFFPKFHIICFPCKISGSGFQYCKTFLDFWKILFDEWYKNHVPGYTFVPRFSFVRLFSKIFYRLQRVLLSVFWYFATMVVKKSQKLPLFSFFWDCDFLFGHYLMSSKVPFNFSDMLQQCVLKNPKGHANSDTLKSFSYFRALDMAPTWAVPGLFVLWYRVFWQFHPEEKMKATNRTVLTCFHQSDSFLSYYTSLAAYYNLQSTLYETFGQKCCRKNLFL